MIILMQIPAKTHCILFSLCIVIEYVVKHPKREDNSLNARGRVIQLEVLVVWTLEHSYGIK